MSERVMWAANQQVQTATMQLDPPELGALQVKLQIFQDQVSVTFTSPNAGVRDAVEQSLPRLREMLAEQGLDLGESFVNDESSDQGRQQRELLADGSYPSTSEQEGAGLPEKGSVGLSLVDYYA
jgi:flagellar hook-length control protein FliK